MAEAQNPEVGYAILVDFGLADLLTEGDDPALWSAALSQHWRTPGDDALYVEMLRFGVGRVAVEGEEADARSAMVPIVEWAFVRVDDGRLRAVSPPPFIAPTGGGQGGGALPPGFGGLGLLPGFMFGLGSDTITVSRPSCGVDEALVYHGMSGGGVGTGETRRWVRDAVGCWTMTDQRTNIWLT